MTDAISQLLPPAAEPQHVGRRVFELLEAVVRDTAHSNVGNFNLLRTTSGNRVPNGTYYVALWADDTRLVTESNESNNSSVGNNQAVISGGPRVIIGDQGAAVVVAGNGVAGDWTAVQKRMLDLSSDAKRGRTLRAAGDATLPALDTQPPAPSKSVSCTNFGIFPVADLTPMP